MKKLHVIALLAFFGLSNPVNSQNLNFLWAKQIGGTTTDYGYSIAVDANGNVYTTGAFTGTADFDPGNGTYNLTAGNYDIFVSKFDASGNFLWAKQFGGPFADYGYSIALDANGNVYITGYFQGTVDFDPGPGTYNLTSAGFPDIFVSKLDPSGNFLWAKRMGGTTTDYGYSIAVNAIGNVSTTGYFQGTVDFDPGPGVYNLTSDNFDIFISTLDASGNFLWAKQFGGPFTDYGYSITVDANGNVYTTGYFRGTADFDPGNGTYNLTSAGLEDIFVSKLDPSGNFLWAKRLGGSSDDRGYSIAVNSIGNVYTTGYFHGTADFDPGSGTFNLTVSSPLYNDVFVSKLDPSGNFLWAKQFGGSTGDYGNSIYLDDYENVYTTGYFYFTTDFDPGDETHNLTAAGGGDIFVSKLNASGNFVWAERMGGSSEDYGNSIAVDANGNVYTTGYFAGTADFDPGNGTYNLTAANYDIFVVKLCQLAAPTITGTPSFCQGSSTTLTSSSADSYLWSNGATTQSITVSTSGNYSVTVSSASGCSAASTATTVIVITAPSPPNITPDGPTTFCQGGSVKLTASAASSYLWSNGATTQSITISTAGQYSVSISNTAGCTAASLSAVSVTVLPPPTATITPGGPTTFCQGSSATLTANPASLYSWSNGATTQSITVSTGGQYSVTITDINGCTDASDATMVTVITPPTATISPPGPVDLCEGESVTLTASTASTYEWSNGATTQSIIVSTTGTYSVTVTGANTCTATSPATSVVVYPLPEATVTASGDTTFCHGGLVTLIANAASSYDWSNGATTQSITVSTGGNYSVTITDANGCTDASPPTLVTVHPLPIVDLGDDITLTQGDSAILNAGQWSEYEWSTNETTPTITVNSMGTYFVTVTDSFGCTAVDSVVITVTSSTTDFDSKYKITVFPNPAQRAINIQCIGGATTSVQVFDNLGRLVLEDSSFAPDGAARTLFLDKAPNGTYYVRIAEEGFAKVISILKHTH